MSTEESNSLQSTEEIPTTPIHVLDLQLVNSALAGSKQSRRDFAERMQCIPKILIVKNAQLGHPYSHEDLQDLMQETLLTIWKRLSSYEGRAALETWAYQFCHFVFLRNLRSLSRPKSEEITDMEPLAERQRQSPAKFEHIYQALSKVGSEDSTLLHLRHFEHLSFKQIGERLALPSSTVKRHYKRAASRLRELLAPPHQEAS